MRRRADDRPLMYRSLQVSSPQEAGSLIVVENFFEELKAKVGGE